MLNNLRRWFVAHPRWTLALATVAALAPFLAKPFNIDDPLFVWAAQHLRAHPGDPFGFNVNWYGTVQPLSTVTENPPLMCYYLAGAAAVFGGGEWGLHLACLLPALAVVLGTHRLAGNFCRWPQFAALAVLFAPGFLVSATSVMCDVTMLAFWIWAVVFWTEGIRQDNGRKLAAAGVLMALALLTKYFGICLVPLLAVQGWLEKRKPGGWLACLLIPLAVLGAYEWLTVQLYGQLLFLAATHYAKSMQNSYGLSSVAKLVNALTFAGGAFALALFCAPLVWPRRALAMIGGGAVLLVACALAAGFMENNYRWLEGGIRFAVEIQIILWSAGGVCVLALAWADVRQKGGANAWLLLLWLAGTFVFAGFINWTVNIRSLLPMAPAVAILIARRLDEYKPTPSCGIKWGLAAAASFSLLAAQADFQLASAVRQNVRQVCAKFIAGPGKLWFQGHWGFEYYMQASGGRAMDVKNPLAQPGDVIAIPVQNVDQHPPDPQKTALPEIFSTPVFPWLATFAPDIGGSFYAAISAPLPFAFGNVEPDAVLVYTLQPSGSPR